MSGVRVHVRAADADPAISDVDVDLPVAPAGWSAEHTRAVAAAVGADEASACVSLRFADGSVLVLPPGRGGWRLVAAMEPGDVLAVDCGATAAPPPAITPSVRTGPSGVKVGAQHPRRPVEGVPLPEEEQNSKRLNMLYLSGPAEVRKALQQVCIIPLSLSWPAQVLSSK